MHVRPLKSSLQELSRRVVTAQHLFALFDFDGTLAPFTADPHAAQLPDAVRQSLIELTRSPRVTAGIVSGRSLADLMSRVDLDTLVYAGNGGLEIRGLGLHFVEPYSFLLEPVLKRIVGEISIALAECPHVQVEDKRLTATVHARGAGPEESSRVTETVLSLLNAHPQFRSRPGRQAYDILPESSWHKGTAVHWIRRELELNGALTLYAGDDISDEDVFHELPGAITIKVGAAPTQAAFLADSPEEVWSLLEMLAGEMRASSNDGGPLSAGASRKL